MTPSEGVATTPQQSKGKGLAITSLVLGIIGVLLSWIPFVNYLAVIIGVIGVVLGAIGIFVSHRVMSIVGTVLSVLAIVFSFIAFSAFVNDVNREFGETGPAVNQGAGQPVQTAPAQPSTPASPLGLGETAQVSSMSGTAELTVTDVEALTPGEFDLAAGRDGYVAADVKIVNIGDKTLSYNTFNWFAQTENGERVMSTFLSSASQSDMLNSGSLVPGGTTGGMLVFDSTDTGLIGYKPWGTSLAEWEYDVSGNGSTEPAAATTTEQTTQPSDAECKQLAADNFDLSNASLNPMLRDEGCGDWLDNRQAKAQAGEELETVVEPEPTTVEPESSGPSYIDGYPTGDCSGGEVLVLGPEDCASLDEAEQRTAQEAAANNDDDHDGIPDSEDTEPNSDVGDADGDGQPNESIGG